MMSETRNFGAPDFVLAWKTIDIRAGTTDPAPFDDGRSLSGLCQMPSEIFPALTASDDDILIALHTHLGSFYKKGQSEARACQPRPAVLRSPALCQGERWLGRTSTRRIQTSSIRLYSC